MATVAKTFNKYLEALFDINDPIYKSLIADEFSTPEITITNPQDYNAGAIASMFEWTRQLSLCLIEQLFLTTATGKYLNYMVHDHIGIVRYSGESDAAYRERVKNFIIAPKVSRASIIFYMRPYSTAEPEILSGSTDSMFADVSFSDIYTSFQNQAPGPEFNYWVFPAITTDQSTSTYFFILRLENTPDADIPKVIDTLNRWIAAGIAYEVQIILV